MTVIETVVVPLDGSEHARWALPVAGWLAQRVDARVHLVSAIASEDERADREAYLSSIQLDSVKVDWHVEVDLDPAGAIHEAIRREGPAVGCISSHGRGRSAALIGSVTNEVVRRGHDPVVVVGPLVGGAPAASTVVACVDDSPAAPTLASTGAAWADGLDEPLVVLTVAEPVPDPVRDVPARRRFGPDGDPDAFLRELVRPFVEHGGQVETRVVWDPVGPSDGVRMFLRDNPAALLVVSTHARSGVARVAFGSVAAAIVHDSPAPVLVVPRPDAAGS